MHLINYHDIIVTLAHGVPVHFLIVTIPINNTVAVIRSEDTTIDARKHARAHTHTYTNTHAHTDA